jgi:hypothetical protein
VTCFPNRDNKIWNVYERVWMFIKWMRIISVTERNHKNARILKLIVRECLPTRNKVPKPQ